MAEFKPPSDAILVSEENVDTNSISNNIGFTPPPDAILVENEELKEGEEQLIEEPKELTGDDWNLTEEDFVKDKQNKLAKLYPEFKFEESGISNQVTVTNKRTGKSDYFDLGSTSLFKSDFDQFKQWIDTERQTMPKQIDDQDYIYSRTGIMVDPSVRDRIGTGVEEMARYDVPIFTMQNNKVSGKRNANTEELVKLINTTESIAKEVGANPGIVLPKFEGAVGFDGFTDSEQDEIKDYIYKQVRQQTGIPLSKDGFLKYYDGQLENNIKYQIQDAASLATQQQMVEYGMPEAASQMYVENKSKSIESNYTEKQKKLLEFNQGLQKTQDQIDILEASKDRSSEDNKRLLKLKQIKSKIQGGIDFLGGGVWSESGDWVNNLKLSDERKKELKNIETQAADLGSALNMFSKESEDDLQKLSTKDLAQKMLDQQMKESEYFTRIGSESNITFNPNKLASAFTQEEAARLMKSAGYNAGVKIVPGDLPRIINNETGKEFGEVSIPFENVFNFGVRSEEAGGYKGGLDFIFSDDGASRGLVSSKDLNKYRVWENNKLETEAELRGLYKLVNLGEDPARIVKPTDYAEKLGFYNDGIPLNGTVANFAGWLETAGRAAGEESLRGWAGFNNEEVEKMLGQSQRSKLDQIKSTVSIINSSKAVERGEVQPIKLSKEQEENFETTLSEMSATGTGGFVPVLLEFALYEMATAGTPIGAARLAKLPKTWQRLAAGAASEEVKMQASSADFGWGTGALFFGLGKTLQPIQFFKKHRVGLNTLSDKYVKAGPAGALTIEGSEIIHSVVDDMMGNKDFGTAIEELYGDGSEAFKRFMSNVIMFKATGAQHFKWRDFQSNSSATKERSILNKRFENLQKDGVDLLAENGMQYEPPSRLINEKEVPPSEGEKSLFVESQLIELSKQNTEAGNAAKNILGNMNKVGSTIRTVDQMLAIRNQNSALDPYLKDPKTGDYLINIETGQRELNPEFEGNFNNFAMNPINDALREQAPKDKNGNSTYVAPEVIFGSGKNDKGFRDNFDKDNNGKDMGDTANYDPNSNKVFVDIDLYTPGKPLHELTHVVFEAYFKNNPTGRTQFTNALRDIFKGVDFGAFKDSDLKREIEQAYKDKRYDSVKAEEYIAMLSEFLSDPNVYYNNRDLAGTFAKEIMSEVRLIKKKFGIGKNAPMPRDAKGLVQMLGDLGAEMRRGYVSKTSASQFAQLGKIDVSDLITETIAIEEGYKKAKKASKQIDLSKSSAEKDAKNKEIISSIKTRAEASGDPAYYSKTPQDVLDLWENNRGLSRSVLEAWQGRTGFEFQKDDAGRLTEKGELDRESMLNALDMKLYRYAELYGNPNNLQQRTNETKEQFEKRKQQVENLDVPFFAYAAENMPKQIGNAIIESGLGVREGNKIIFKETIGGEAGEMAMSSITDPDITEANIRSTEKSMDFEEGRTDADGKALIEPISIIEPSKQESTTKSINERITEVPESYKATPDLSNVASEFGVRENRINNEDGTIRVGSFKFKDSEFKSAQDKFSEPGFLEKWYDIAIPEPQAGEGAREGVRGFDTGLQASLKNIVYQKSGVREKTGPGKETQIKKPFSEVELPLQKLLGIEPGKDIIQNSKVNTALKNSIHQLGKAITNRTIRQKEGLTPNERENLASGKSRAIASKPIFVDSIGKIRNITPEQRLKALAYLRDEGRDIVDINDISEIIRKTGISEKGVQELLTTFEKIINDPTNNKEVKKLIEKRDAEDFDAYVKNLSEKIGLSIEDAKTFAEKEILNYKDLYKELDVEYQGASPKEGFKTVTVSDKNIEDYKNTIKKVFGGLNLDMLEANNPTIFSYMLNSMNSNSMLKFRDYTGHGGRFKDGSTITKKTFGVKSSAEFIRELLEDPNFGKKGNKKYTENFIKKSKYAFQPSWGEKGNKGQSEALSELYIKDKDQWLSKQQEIYASKDAIKDYETLQEAIDATYEANKYVYKEFFKSLLDVSNSESLFLGQLQTSASSGVPRGLVSMMSVTTKPKQKEGKSKDLTHNEHALEMFNIMKRFHEIKNSKTSRKNKENLIDIMVEGVSQHLIPKELQGVKDSPAYKGSKGRVSENDLLNTFVIERSGQDQVFIAGEYAGMTVSEMMIKKYGAETIKQMLKDIPYERLSSEGAKAKQAAEYYKEKQKVFKDNIKEANEYNVYASKDLSESINLGNMSSRDKANEFARKRNKVPKKIRVFDFDDTMAKTKSLVFYNRPSTTKQVKPKLKAIVMAGTPGGGKSSVVKGLGLVKDGFREVNQDISLEWLKSKEGLPAKEADYSKEQKSVRSKLGAQARKIAAGKLDKFSKQGDGIILDGTGASLKATESKVKALEDLGYEVSMLYVDTPKETALARNKARAERSLPDFIVEKTWDAVNANKEVYAGRFGNRFYEVNTEGLKQGEVPKEISEAIRNDLAATERGRLTAEEFAKKGKGLVEEGFAMDFSDFNIVREGERGPLFEVAEKIRDARGTEDVFILTARAPESAPAIREFLKSEGLDIPLKNITGLGNSTGEAKAQWMVDKVSEGYNDFYFADDALANVRAVKDALSVYDIKSKVQQAYASKNLSKEFNEIIEAKTGIKAFKEYSAAKAKTVGAKKGGFKFFVPYSAEDFTGLIYPTLSKGKLGDKQMAWYKTNLLDPYSRAMNNLSRDRVQLMSDFKALKKQLDVPKDLRKTNDTGFTNEQAVRVYLYNKTGNEVPGLSKTDLRELLDVVNSDGKLKAFADQILSVTKGDGYVKPGENWLVGSITTDLIDLLNTTKRKKYLEEWQGNIDQIYSKENLNKLEAAYGSKYREALENIISRMKSGKNRLATGSRLSNQMLDYINGSNAAIMFFNTRSAILQTISATNFINWSFNNPYQAGKAFANQRQYWKDFTELMNSDYLLDRRNGLKLNIAESEIADAAATSKNKVKGALKYILQKGYLPTQYADSFAIASGGATWYRNRINDLIKRQGLSEAEAKIQAMTEFREIAEVSQQSSDPSKISQQQASDAGRLILMFANTPMQYTRLQKRAIQDLINKRGDAKTNVSKIAYYGFVQNMIFNALQQAMFAVGFGDENEEKDEKRVNRTINGMVDSTLRGLGIGGQAVSVGKNFLMDIYERSGRKRPEYVDAVYKLLQFSPPISSKISKIRQAAYTIDKSEDEIFKKGFAMDNPALMATAKVISATANIPFDRVLQKMYNIEGALAEDTEMWQTIAMLGGWPEWDIKPEPIKSTKKKSSTSRRRKSSRRRRR